MSSTLSHPRRYDRLIFGIHNAKERERLLRESLLTLKKTDEICRASESTAAQLKEVSEGDTENSASFRNKFGRRPRGNKGDKADTDESTKTCIGMSLSTNQRPGMLQFTQWRIIQTRTYIHKLYFSSNLRV